MYYSLSKTYISSYIHNFECLSITENSNYWYFFYFL